MNIHRKNEAAEKILDGQKPIADTVSVPLSKDEIKLLIEGLCDMSITNKQALNVYQKLAKKLNTLEASNPGKEQEGA